MKFETWFLKEWRAKDRGNTQKKLAEALDTTPSNLFKLLGGSIPDRDIMRRIAKLTKGKVTANDFYN